MSIETGHTDMQFSVAAAQHAAGVPSVSQVKSGGQTANATADDAPSRIEEQGKIQPERGKLSPAEMSALADKLTKEAEVTERGLEFTVDQQADRTVIKVFDKETEELIRQIPAEEALVISRNVNEFLENGDLVNVKV